MIDFDKVKVGDKVKVSFAHKRIVCKQPHDGLESKILQSLINSPGTIISISTNTDMVIVVEWERWGKYCMFDWQLSPVK